jgi:heptosyltransferase I
MAGKSLPLATQPESICLLRLSAVGDVCNVLPLVRTLQKAWPDTRIAWIVGRTEYQLIKDVAGIEFFVFDKSGGWRSIRKLRRQMAGRKFDVLLHMQAALRASMVALAVPARIKLGFGRQQAKDFQWLFTHAQTRSLENPHVIDAFFSFSEALGIQQREPVWNLPIPETARYFALRHIPTDWERFLVVSPCSSNRFRNWRNWRVERYAHIIDYAAERHGFHTILTGGPSEIERNHGREISALAEHKPLNLIGQTDLKSLMAVIEQAAAVIAPDSGPIHLANALGVPPIGLYAGSNPERTGPYLHRNWVVNAYPRAVQKAFGCSVSQVRWGKRVREPDALDLIAVEEVEEKLDLLARETTLEH